MTKNPLRVLLVEDSPADAELLLRELSACGYEPAWERVDTPEAFAAALAAKEWDAVLCDFLMPRFNAMDAVNLLKKTGKDIPFLVVSGAIGEEVAVELIRAGAHGYFVKDKIKRLADTLERERLLAQERRKRRWAEETLRESDARFRTIFNSSSVGMVVVGPDLRFISANGAYCAFLGYAEEELKGRTYLELTHPDDRDVGRPEVQAMLKNELNHARVSKRYVRKDGEVVWGELAMSLVRDSQDRPLYFITVVEDVSARKKAEEALRESEERYRLIAENSQDLIGMINREGRFTYASPAYRAVLGHDPAELAGASVFDLIHPGDASSVREAFAADAPEGRGRTLTFRLHHKNGPWHYMEASVRWAKGGPGGAAYGVVVARDQTERRKLEEQLLQSQKMDAVGRLAGGVAHDFNNLLSVILGYSEIILRELKTEDPFREDMDEIHKSAQKAAALTRQLLAFSRKQLLLPRMLDLNTVVHDVSKMLRRLISEEIVLSLELDPALGKIKADPGQMEQVVMNLAVNARDAMPQGGRLSLKTRSVDWREDHPAKPAAVPLGRYVCLEVRDTGVGMDEEMQKHLFEPFYTTKDTGKGTGLGLGLATLYGIVKQSGGHISVESRVGGGTTFFLYFPRVEGRPEAVPAKAPHAEAMPRGRENILVVEDDEGVREFTRRILSRLGYQVFTAAGPGEALLMCERKGESLQLMLTDVKMPQINGLELAARVGSFAPHLKVLFMSGYNDPDLMGEDFLKSGRTLLVKPFTPMGLAARVRDELDAGGAAS